jgi:hypothetical protein
MRDRLFREKLNSIGERIVVDAVKHAPAEPLQRTLPNVNWDAVLAQSTEPQNTRPPLAIQRLPNNTDKSRICSARISDTAVKFATVFQSLPANDSMFQVDNGHSPVVGFAARLFGAR